VSDHYNAALERLALLEFDRDRKSMSVICKRRGAKDNVLLVKGAAECVLERCNRCAAGPRRGRGRLWPAGAGGTNLPAAGWLGLSGRKLRSAAARPAAAAARRPPAGRPPAAAAG
jgi:Ca2+-transporting ATPase